MKGYLILGAGAFAGNFVFERFLIKRQNADGSESGFVDLKEGAGLDDLFRVGAIVGGILLARKFIGGGS